MTNKPIPQEVIDNVRAKANIKDVLEYLGVDCKSAGGGGEWVAYSPFRQDKHIGSFRISERKNIAKDFATGESWDAIEAVMDIEHKNFNEAVRLLAAKYDVIIDDDIPVPRVQKLPPRKPPVQLPTLYRTLDTAKAYLGNEGINPLICWLKSLPLDKKLLGWALKAYMVGTATKGDYAGWTVWWHINELGYVQTGKLMGYKPDGHRDRELMANGHEKTIWAHTLWKRAGMYDPNKNEARTGLFGMHLLSIYPDAQVAVVESEKTAVICSTFCDPKTKIWVATGGLSSLRRALERVMKMGRQVALYPDKDGFENWTKEAADIGYKDMVVVSPKEQGWTEADGPKADIADILVRVITAKEVTLGMKVAVKLGHPEKAADLDNFINALNLREI